MDTEKRKRFQSIPPHILHHFRSQAKSGKTIRAYSLSAGISPLTFYDWRKKHGKHFDASEKREPHSSVHPSKAMFATFPAQLLQHSTDTPLLDIEFNDCITFRLYRGATAEWFAPFRKLFHDGDTVC